MAANYNNARLDLGQAQDEARRISQANATGNFFLGATPRPWMTNSVTDSRPGMPARTFSSGTRNPQNQTARQPAPADSRFGVLHPTVTTSPHIDQLPAQQQYMPQEQPVPQPQQGHGEALTRGGLVANDPSAVIETTNAQVHAPVFNNASPLVFAAEQDSPFVPNRPSYHNDSTVPIDSPIDRNLGNSGGANQYPQLMPQSQQSHVLRSSVLASEGQNAPSALNDSQFGYSTQAEAPHNLDRDHQGARQALVSPTVQAPGPTTAYPDRVHGQMASEPQPTSLPFQDMIALTFHSVTKAYQGNMEWASKEVDTYRLALLREAYNAQDLFYLCAHQILCIYCIDPAIAVAIGINEKHHNSLKMLPDLMLHADRPSATALRYFAAFPAPIDRLINQHPAYKDLQTRVESFLTLLAQQWDQLLSVCLRRRYPPLVQEQVMGFHLQSVVLQRLIFCSIQRAISGDHSPELNLRALAIFDEDHSNYNARMSAGRGLLTGNQFQAELRRLSLRYHGLIAKSTAVNPQGAPPSYFGSAQSSPIKQISPTVPWPDASANTPTPVQQSHPRRRPSQSQPGIPTANAFANFNAPIRPQANVVTPGSSMAGVPVFHSSPSVMPWSALRSSAPTTPLTLSPGTYSSGSGRSISRQTMPMTGRQSNSGQGAPNRPQSSRPHPVAGSWANPKTFLIPPLGVEPIETTHPDTDRVALHQAHLKSPRLEKTDSTGKGTPNSKLYQYVSGFAVVPTVIENHDSWLPTRFPVQRTEIFLKAKDFDSSEDTMPRRLVTDGSITYRLRAVKIGANVTKIEESEWMSKDTCWPPSTFLKFNNQVKELRKKLHHHKDLPVDLTSDIREGTNELLIALLRPPPKENANKFAFAVEIVQVADQTRVDSLVSNLPADESLRSIMQSLAKPKVADRLNGTTATAGPSTNGLTTPSNSAPSPDSDPDIQILDAHLSIDLIDPFTAILVTNPARSSLCNHRECFDLEAFFMTRRPRPSQHPDAPTNPDEWKCPICSCDARPSKLIIDSFLKMVRDSLGKTKDQAGATDDDDDEVRAILVQADGSWSFKKEVVKQGSGRGGRLTGDGGQNGPGDGVGLGLMLGTGLTASPKAGSANQKPSEIIDVDLLDDD